MKKSKTPSSVLSAFMEKYGLNAYSLSKELALSYSVIRLILLDKIGISTSNAFRFAKFFGNTPDFWLSLQKEADISEAEKDKKLQSSLKSIKRAVKKTKKTKAAVKPRRKKRTLSDKRKAAAKVPGSKRASRSRRKK
jgi:addiction module HigA family antidote